MQTIINKARIISCFFILLGFFIPSYNGVSGLTFIPLVFSAIEETSEITIVDAFVAIIPLVFIPLSTIAVLIRTFRLKPTRKTYRALPLICLFAFSIILVMSLKTISGSGMTSLQTFAQIRGGYYMAGIFCLILPFTRNPFIKRTKQQALAETELAV